jgi:hypothetical protein
LDFNELLITHLKIACDVYGAGEHIHKA